VRSYLFVLPKENGISDAPPVDGASVAADRAAGAAIPATAAPRIPLLPYQYEDVFSEARFRWNCWARQTGKSFAKSLRRLLRGLTRRRDQVFVSAGERQCRELMDKARRHCLSLGILCDWIEPGCWDGATLQPLQLRLPGGVRVFGLPANPLTVRGYSGDVLLDEFAMVADDRELWAAMLPTLLREDGEMDVASTPRGKANVFYELRFNPAFSTSELTLPQAVAQGLEADVEAMRKTMNDDLLFRQEFLCEFIDGAAAFLTLEQIDACMDDALVASADVDSLSRDARRLFVGVDIGRVRDLTVVWVLARPPEPDDDAPWSTAGWIELPQATFQRQFDLLCELLSVRQVRKCCLDATGMGLPLAERLVARFGAHRVEPVVFTATVKSDLATALRVAVEARAIRIPRDERVRRDWHSVERTISESGHFRLHAPRREGSHADRFWAAALAVRAASQAPDILESQPSRPLAYARKGTW
jgi:phage FluMu gp28-like protein